MIELLIISIYFLIGFCWANIADEFIFKSKKSGFAGHIVHAVTWPIDIIIGGMSR